MRTHLQHRVVLRAVTLAAALLLSACDPLSLTAAGLGGSAAVAHTLNGITYRTFTLPAATVKVASIDALNRMGMKIVKMEKGEKGAEVVRASATDRDIEITLEPLSPKATRMKVVARNGGIFFDAATASEIIMQTERLLAAKA